MIPKDPVYPLTAAVERVKETILDQDAEGWLRNAIAADRITWAYVWIKKDQYGSWPSPIDILPMVAIMEVPDLEIDWLKGTAAVRQRYRGVVEYPVVVSRRDLDRELANIARLGMAGAEDRNDERPELKQEAEPGGRSEATAAQKRQRPQGGRRPASQSQTQKVWDEFDKIAKPELLTFVRGELTKIAGEIADKTGYKSNTVEKLIRFEYRDLEEKRPSA